MIRDTTGLSAIVDGEARLEPLLREAMALALDGATAEVYADVRDKLRRAGRPIPENDLWIAALVLQYALPLVSRDLHFDFVPGLKRIAW